MQLSTPTALAALALFACAPVAADAAIIGVNLGNAGSANERGVAFNLTNNSATETVFLTGLFNLPVTNADSETFALWTRDGTVVGNVGAGATNWTSRGTATATGQSYSGANPNLTAYTFADAANLAIAPGATLGIWIKDTDAEAIFRYVNGGSTTVNATDEFSPGGSLTYTGYIGLGSTGGSPTVANSTFGPTRNFIGSIGYTVPEPASLALLAGGAVCMLRRRTH